jgi:hypothetical protein
MGVCNGRRARSAPAAGRLARFVCGVGFRGGPGARILPLGLAPLGLAPPDHLALFQDCGALAAELGLKELSMGMSSDWREAAAAGSTWVRLGSALFGSRAPAEP